mgnify:CR=1 FL=1
MKIFFNSRVLGSEQEKFEYFFFFSISEENFIREESDIEVRGFPGQVQMSYVCYHARTRKYGKEDEEDVYVHVFKEIEKKINDTHFLIKYTHQTSGGQSGGPVILHTDNDVQLIGIHVSGDQVSEVNFILFFQNNIKIFPQKKMILLFRKLIAAPKKKRKFYFRFDFFVKIMQKMFLSFRKQRGKHNDTTYA